MKKNTFHSQIGQATIIMVLFTMSVVLVIVAAVGLLTYNDIKISGTMIASSRSYYASESGIEDAIYRIATGKDYNSNYTLAVENGSADVEISGPITSLVVTSEADVDNRIRKVQVDLGTTQSASNISFNYGVQVGYGGLILSNNSGINGNVYSNGPISGGSGAFVTGSAFSASGASATANQTNDSPATPASNIAFRNVAASQDLAQSFQVSADEPLNKFQFYIRKVGNPSNATVRLVANSGSNPGTTTLASGTLTASGVGTSYSWVDVTPTSSLQLNVGNTYWVVIDNSTQSAGNYFEIGANSTYSNGQAKVGQQGGTWNNTSPTGLDAYFKVFTGGTVGSLSGVAVGNAGTGNAYAHTVNSSTVAGTKYCQTTNNSPACNTSLADPAPADFPISDANLAQFKAEAAAGDVISGNYTLVNGASGTLGPARITGNMNLSNNVTLTLTGTVWVEGTVTLSNNVVVRLDPNYGEDGGTFIADGFINLSNNSTFQGSGQSGSYMLVITTNDCNGTASPTGQSCTSNSAMVVGNNAGTVVMFAPYGQVLVSNNAGAKEITGYRINLSNNAVITYETGLANANFSSGPGGGFQINTWKEVE